MQTVDATNTDRPATCIARLATVKKDALQWFTGVDQDKAFDDLEERFVLAR
jgi:hypothetical protein